MPANLTPQYKEAEERFRQAASHEEKLAALHEMIALLPKHKGTDHLFADLKRRGRWENTIVVVTADHGEAFAERGLLQHGHAPYVEQARVPLLIRLPARFDENK